MSDLVPKDRPLNEQKKIAEDILAEAFARDLITMEEFENRLAVVQTAGSNRTIQAELQDLPARFPARAATATPAPTDNTVHNLILSSRILRGAKLREPSLRTRLILAEETLDYSKTVLDPGTYYVEARVILGELNIIVPENYSISLDMTTVLSEVIDKGCEAGPNSPRIIVRGKVILGSVKVKIRKDGIIKRIIDLIDR
ncbi:MAG: hypothetical protein JW874_00475 [Spirochaetales bacterium]|nr:hypothetical protein [Spirochaetales bacterium]